MVCTASMWLSSSSANDFPALLRPQNLSARLQSQDGRVPDVRTIRPAGECLTVRVIRKSHTSHRQELQDRPTYSRLKRGGKVPQRRSTPAGTGAWPPEVSVHKVAWNQGNGLARSSMLASATAAGLCRIDMLWGRWMKDKVPYQGVDQIRMEDGVMDVESDGSDD